MFRTLLGLMLAVLLVPAAWAQGYRIQPGDVLQMEVLEDPSLNRSLMVLPDGTISLPLVGTVRASGKSIEAMKGAISAALAPNFATAPTVYLSVGQLNPVTSALNNAAAQSAAANYQPYNTVSIYAMGEFNTQGKVDVKSGTTLLQFLAETGGLSRFAATKRIQLRRADSSGAEQVYLINYDAIEAGTSKNGATVLREGDVIVVPQRRLFE